MLDIIMQFGSLGLGAITTTYYIVWFVINVLILVWVYKDAEAHHKNGALWAVLVFFFGCCCCCCYLIKRKS